jgi:hypothetical protein
MLKKGTSFFSEDRLGKSVSCNALKSPQTAKISDGPTSPQRHEERQGKLHSNLVAQPARLFVDSSTDDTDGTRKGDPCDPSAVLSRELSLQCWNWRAGIGWTNAGSFSFD